MSVMRERHYLDATFYHRVCERQGRIVSHNRREAAADLVVRQPDRRRRWGNDNAGSLPVRLPDDRVVFDGQVVRVAEDHDLSRAAGARITLYGAMTNTTRMGLYRAPRLAKENARSLVGPDRAAVDQL